MSKVWNQVHGLESDPRSYSNSTERSKAWSQVKNPGFRFIFLKSRLRSRIRNLEVQGTTFLELDLIGGKKEEKRGKKGEKNYEAVM